ncbi:Inositol 2-dehydrogenase/D-chiro-inositol 3-dehydrogenase [subsurface metagenome]
MAVIGLGLVGQLTVQMLKVAGCRVIGIDLIKSRVALAQSLGMDYGIVSTEADLISQALNYTSGLGTDATIITAATKSELPLQQSMGITRKKGRVVVVGDVGLRLNRSPFYEKEIDLVISCSYGPGRYDETYERKGIDYPYAYVRWTENRNMQEYLRLLSESKVNFKALISREYPIEDASSAYQELRQEGERPIAVLLIYPTEERLQSTKLEKKTAIIPKARKKEGLINVALIGAGNFARSAHLPNLQKLSNLYHIHSIVSRTGSTAKEIAKQYKANYCTTDYKEVLKDEEVDMVLIATRHNLHAPMAMEAAKAGKTIFLEKPLALNQEELNELVTVLQQTQVPFMVGFNRRFSPCAVRAKEVISKRQNPIIVNYRVNAGYILIDHWVHTEEGGGRIIGEACHMFDLFNYLTDSSVESVTASAITPRTANISSRDNFTATLKYLDGSICTLTYTALGAREAGKEYIEIYADGKTLIIDDFKTLRILGLKTKGINSNVSQKGHREELIEFAKYIKGQTDLPISMEQMVSATVVSFSVDDMVKGQRSVNREVQ